MRTDVKLGFVIGGILLAVMVVYALVVGRGGSTVPDQTAVLTPPATESIDATGNNSAGGASTTIPPVAPAHETPVAVAPPEPLQTITPTAVPEPVAPLATEAATAASKWNWDRLLHEGSAPELMTSSNTRETSTPADPKLTDIVTPRPPTEATNAAYTAPTKLDSGHTGMIVDPLPPAMPIARVRTHVVKSGETLSAISFATYGSIKHWSLIAKANPTVNPDKLKPGIILTLPEMSEKAAATVASTGDEKAIDSGKQYKVLPGDSLHKIAQKLYGKTDLWEKIYEANKVAIGGDPAKLKTGTVLTLPESPAKEKVAR